MSAGLSKPRLARLRDGLAGYVERGEIAGLVALLYRRGEVHVEVHGALDRDRGAPMRRDSLFRIASMSKPIAAAAAMILVEEAKLRLDDPVDRWLPELASRKVLRAIDAPVDDTVPARRPITVRDLLTFRLGYGLTMAPSGHYPIQKAIEAAGLAPGPNAPDLTPDEYMRRIGNLPLLHQPGEQWRYHTGSDILGVLIARATGIPLGDFLQQRIFAPLGMNDTAFSVPEAKLDRLTTAYRPDAAGRLTLADPARGGRYAKPPAFPAAGGGLVSTADDFLAFAKLLLNHGKHGASRLLARPTVETMLTDHLTPAQKAASPFVPGFWDSRGWGFGVAITTARDDIAATPGSYGWAGGRGTVWANDPREELIGILLTQCEMTSPNPPEVFRDFWTLAYQAIDD